MKKRLSLKTHNKRKHKGSQMDLFSPNSPFGKMNQFGGSKLTSNPKRHRPLHFNKSVHLILKSALKGGQYSMKSLKNFSQIKKYVYELAERFNIKIERFENVGNHLHLVIRTPSQEAYASYIRGLTSAIARFVVGAKKSESKDLKFWEARPYTINITFGKHAVTVDRYMNKNRIEAIGFDLFVEEQLKLTG